MKSKSWLKNFIVRLVLCSTLLFTSMWACSQPVARFSGTTLSGCAPILVHFTDESTGNPNYWKWDLGNGTISYLQNPSVTYFSTGLYSVKLVVKSAAGEDSAVRTNYVMVYAVPVVNFSASQTTSCGPLSVNFSNQSTAGNSWQWDFGDGIFADLQHPAHTYTQTGNYNVSLKVTNSDGCNATLLKQAYISVNEVKALFANSVAARCNPTKITFQNNSSGNGRLQYKWFFGNGDSSVLQHPEYTYPTGGNYTVRLVVKNEFGCEDVFSKNISVENAVSAAFSSNITSACKAPAAIQFSNQSLTGNNYYWNFGDTLSAATANPTHVFTDTGKFTVKLVVRNNNGCLDSLIKRDYIHIQKPFVLFDNLPDSGCVPFTKKLVAIDNGTDSIINYSWNFGDGHTAAAISPTHSYTTPGYYTVSLVTTGLSGCKDTTIVEHAIGAGNKPSPAFTADIRNSCAQTEISFTDESTGGATMWQWDFGDNSQAMEQHPKHIFTDTGFLDVQMIVFNGGCADTVRKHNYVYIKPAIAKLKYDFTCAAPFTFSFSNHSIGAESWQWDFGDGATSTELNPVHTYSDTGLYSVMLTALNQTTGCNFLQTKN
ncbi:MAG: PKD domain-containing protein [Chitinophagaceae bacterium]|nr:PKD domain-containing protein [Chitinophagaceae bacterium]